MNLLVLNSGSSSIKFSVFAADSSSPRSLFEGDVMGIGSGDATFSFHRTEEESSPLPIEAQAPLAAIARVVDAVTQPSLPRIDAVGYRVVHPGPKIDRHLRIDDTVLDELDRAALFAPLHDPSAVEIIRETMARLPDIPHFACFDTIFHQTMPDVATVYPVPVRYREQGLRRYGAHGLSCESVVEQMRCYKYSVPHRMAIAHLGSGCSVTALLDGRSMDTTMGLTPTGGVVMGTRPGDLDPGVILYLLRQQKADPQKAVDAVERLLNHDSGIAALSGLPNDMRSTRKAAADGNPHAKLAIDVFTRSVRKALGSFSWIMGSLDAIVFTGGIGEHDSLTRAEILDKLETVLDPQRNISGSGGSENSIQKISASESNTEVLVIPAKEDWMIAVHMHRMLKTS